jgi:hypothetical protein
MKNANILSMILQWVSLIILFHGCEKEPVTVTNDGIHETNKTLAGYYVATDGSDANPGTFEKPFASWQKAFNTAKGGDTVYIRGGTYHPDNLDPYGVYISNKSGSEGKMINIFAYPGERPILDVSTLTSTDENFGILLTKTNYWHLKGLEVTGTSQHGKNQLAMAVRMLDGNNNIFELLKLHDNEGTGLNLANAVDNNLVLNCDFYDNYDPHTGNPGDNADGCSIAFVYERNGNERINTIRGCRSWHNSDDGFDFWQNEGIIVMDSCWSFNNGYEQGNGNGFKMGATLGTAESYSQRTITNSFAYANRQNGFDQSEARILMEFSKNISYQNSKSGFYLCEYQNLAVNLKYNISYNNGHSDCFPSSASHTSNSWDLGITINNDYFKSVDSTGITGSRQSNGSLPKLDFLNPK